MRQRTGDPPRAAASANAASVGRDAASSSRVRSSWWAEAGATTARQTIAEVEKSAERDRQAAARDIADLERRLATARADADAAHQRAAQLSAQVSDLASALASLSPSGRPGKPAPAQPAPA